LTFEGRMVATRNQARLARNQLEPGIVESIPTSDLPKHPSAEKDTMAGGKKAETDVQNPTEPDVPEKSTEGEGEVSGSQVPDECSNHTYNKGGKGMGDYLRGFGKRVVFCTMLVLLGRLAWPRVQPYVWPEQPGKEGKLYVLTDRSFRGHVSRGDHFLLMYAPWCGHCQRIKPTWEQLAKAPGVGGVKIGKVDCTANPDVCKQHDVNGYPTLIYFRDGKKLGKYEEGDKSLEGLKAHLKKMAAGKQKSKTKKSKSKKSAEL